MADEDEDIPGGFASPPCSMHELDPAYFGLAETVDPRQARDVMRWRKAERERLIAERLKLASGERGSRSEAILAALIDELADVRGLTVSIYWPFRGEPDLRALMEHVSNGGGQIALSVVVERGKPLVFRSWAPGESLERGVWNIPVPANGREVVPHVTIAPLVGFDRQGYRLGYGGGYYDRTLAAMPKKPRLFGVGFALACLCTIYPQPHDIPMDRIVTEDGVIDLSVAQDPVPS